MDFEALGNLLNSIDALQRFQRHSGLELIRCAHPPGTSPKCPSPLRCGSGSCLLRLAFILWGWIQSLWATSKNHNHSLASGRNFGIYFTHPCIGSMRKLS